MFRARAGVGRKAAARWTDLRLWLGLCLIVGSMLAGAYLLSADEDSITVWRASADLAVGDLPQVEPVTVRLEDSASIYLSATTQPEGRMRVPVQAGALLPAAAVGAGDSAQSRLVTVAVDSLHTPVGLSPGDVVDVWATPQDSSNPAPPNLILAQAHVHDVDRDNVGVAGEVPVVLEVDREQSASIIGASRGRISLVEVPLAAQSSSSRS